MAKLRTRWFPAVCIIVAAASWATGEQLPSFKVTGQDMTALALLVPLRKCTKASANTPFYTECGRHVRAYYFYGARPETEEGSVGYAEGKQVFTKNYQKLF